MGVTRFLVLLCFWTGAYPLDAQQFPSVVTVYFSERPPFSVVDGQTGILVNLTKAVLSEVGIRPRFIELPPNRILELLRAGQPDSLGIGWLRPQEREGWPRFSAPLYQDRPVVALVNARVASSLGTPLRVDQLLSSGLTLGLKGGTTLGPVLDQKIRALGLVPLETVLEVPQMLKMIQGGRMDYTLLGEDEARYLLGRDPALKPGLVLIRLSDPPPGNYRYLLFSRTFDNALASRIDAAIEKVRNSSRYRELTTVD